MLVGCADFGSTAPAPPPPEGYEAVRFKQEVSIRDHAINTFTFTTGSTFVADHQFQSGTVYCGTALINHVTMTVPQCFALDGDTTMILRPDNMYMVRREIPLGSFERFRMK